MAEDRLVFVEVDLWAGDLGKCTVVNIFALIAKNCISGLWNLLEWAPVNGFVNVEIQAG